MGSPPARLAGLLLVLGLSLACDEQPVRPGGDAALEGGADLRLPGELALHDLPLDRPPAAQEKGPSSDLPAPDGAQPLLEHLLYDQGKLQFTVADNGFHPLIKPGDALPIPNWSSPTDYYDGELRVRYQITAPASQKPGQIQTCIWTMPGYSPESCSDQVPFTGVGTFYNTKLIPSGWWKKDNVPLDFAHPEKFLIRVVLRGTSGCNVTTYNVAGACWSEWPDFQSLTFRVTIVMVAKGATFSGWQSYP